MDHDPLLDYSEEAEELFRFWNDLGKPLSKTRAVKSRTFERAMQGIEKALSKHDRDFDLIADAMEDYYELVTSDNTILNKKVPSHVVSLADFFGFQPFTKGRIASTNPASKIKSWFDESLKGLPYLVDTYGNKSIEDENPEVTEKIRRAWEESEFYMGRTTVKDEANFRECARRLVEWQEKNEGKYDLQPHFFYYDWAGRIIEDYLLPALCSQNIEKRQITSAWLATDLMFYQRLHIYLKKKGLYIG